MRDWVAGALANAIATMQKNVITAANKIFILNLGVFVLIKRFERINDLYKLMIILTPVSPFIYQILATRALIVNDLIDDKQ